MMNPESDLVYYIAYIMPAAAIIFINLVLFCLVARVLFMPRIMPANKDVSNQGLLITIKYLN